MFIIRLAAEALSLTERNEQRMLNRESNGHTAAGTNGKEPRSCNPGGKRFATESLETEQDCGGSGSRNASSNTRNKRLKLNNFDHVTTDQSDGCELNKEKNSILFDLLSGRENLNTACHRSQLFLFSVKRAPNNGTTRQDCDGLRRRKPLRPVKNANVLNGLCDGDTERSVKSMCSISEPSTESAWMPLTKQSHLLSNRYTTKLSKSNGKTIIPQGRFTRLDRDDMKQEHSSQPASGFHVDRSIGKNSICTGIRFGVSKKHTNEYGVEQPLDLSSPKADSIKTCRNTEKYHEFPAYSSTNKLSKFHDGCGRHHERIITINRERIRKRGRFRNGTSVHNEKPIFEPVIEPSTVSCTTTSNIFPNSTGLLIPGLLNFLLTPNSHALAPSIAQALQTAPIHPSSQSYSGTNNTTTSKSIPYSKVSAIAKPVSLYPNSQIQSTSTQSSPVSDSDAFDDIVRHEDYTRVMELYTKYACMRMHGPSVFPKPDLTNLRNKVPPDMRTVTQYPIVPSPRMTPQGHRVEQTAPCELLPWLSPNSHPVHNTDLLPRPVQSTHQNSPVHPLVDRILSTLYALNPLTRSVRELEVLKSLSNSVQETTTTRLKTHVQISLPAKIPNTPIDSSTASSICPNIRHAGTSLPNSERLTHLKSDRIFTYLVQLIKHPEALLVDCFNSTPRDSADWWDRSAVQRGLSLAVFQLMLRGESDRVQLFLATWHLLYLLCVLEQTAADQFPGTHEARFTGSVEEQREWRTKMDALRKLKKWVTQLNMSTQMYSLIRGVILCQGTRVKLDVDTVLEQCISFTNVSQSGTSNSTSTASLSTNSIKLKILRKLLHKLCTFPRDFIKDLFISASSTQAVELYLENWIQNG